MYAILILATLLTSLLSGILSMAGGMILMGVFGFFLSVPAAMVLHGVAQTASNGSRIWLHRQHIRWAVLPPYMVGAFLILLVFSLVAFVPDKALLFILVGTFPFLALALPDAVDLDMEKSHVAFLSGLLVTGAQMLAGASGPVLDIFYIKSRMTRYEILGTKAITQTLGHVIKLGYYAFFLVSIGADLPLAVYPMVIVAALTGNWAGKQLIHKISDDQFKAAGRYIIMIIGGIFIAKGLQELLQNG